MSLSRTQCNRGFTLVEITVILLVLVILGAILLPITERYIDLARVVRAKEDVGVIASAIVLMLYDVHETYFLQIGNGTSAGGAITAPPDHSLANGNRVRMLVSDGSTPGLALTAPPSALSWLLPGPCLASTPPVYNCDVDLLANHLSRNAPAGITGNRYRVPDEMAPTNIGWRGAYLGAPISADPWGNYYAVNVEFLDPKIISGGPAFMMDVVVLSAGPDGEVNSEYQADGLIAQGDDIIAPVKGSSY
jgi:Tfp pilus assembly protein PilE